MPAEGSDGMVAAPPEHIKIWSKVDTEEGASSKVAAEVAGPTTAADDEDEDDEEEGEVFEL